MGRQQEIIKLAQAWSGPLHAIINNAAETPRKREETPERIERQFATNVLGYFWMIQAFTPILTASAPSRIINVASYWAGGLELNDLEFIRRDYDNDQAYRQAKQADRMLTAVFAERLKPQQVSVYACHPGDVHSTLSHNLGFGGHETPEQGADTPVWLATTAEGTEYSGKYFEHRHPVRCSFMQDKLAANALFECCAAY